MAGGHVKWPLAGVLGGLVILASGAAPAEAHWPGRGSRLERPSLQAQLGLTAAQVQAIREIRQRQRETVRHAVRALADARRAVREMTLGDADESALAAKRAEMQELAGRVLDARIQTLREIAAVLTPEQRAQLRELGPRRGHRRAPLAG